MKTIVFICTLVLLTFTFCKKKESPKSTEKLYTFNDLHTDHDTIIQGNTTNIKASITGQGTCSWSVTAGDVFGSGSTVLFGASTCCVGYHTITCTVKDANGNSDSKSVNVFVRQ